MKFYPSILSDSIEEVEYQLQVAQSLKSVETVQIDIVDGLFADNLTITPTDLLSSEFGKLKLDFHLMVDEPMDFVHEIIDALDQLPVRAVIAQIEHLSYPDELIKELKTHQLEIGLSLDLHTPIDEIKTEIYQELGLVQLMAVEAGFQGQVLQDSIYLKIKQLKQFLSEQNLKPEIIVDGGIKANNLVKLKKSGINALVVGSLLWSADNPQDIAAQLNTI